jgi:hypothetical protein
MISTDDDLRSLLAKVAAATPIGPAPTAAAALPRRRTRRTKAVVLSSWAVAILIPVAGFGAASAAGLIPVGALSAFPDNARSSGDTRVDLSTAKLVVSIPGPTGQRFDVWVAHGAHGFECVSFVFTPVDAPAAGPAVPSWRDFAGATCDQPPKHGNVFNSSGGGTSGDSVPTNYALSAGAAVRADVRLPDGSVVPATTANGWIAGWFPASLNSVGAILTGYAADGSVVGHAHVGAPG